MSNESINYEGTVTSENESKQDVKIETTSGPSKGFIALVVGGVVATAVGVGVAIKKHKNKKDNVILEEVGEEDDYDYYDDEDLDLEPKVEVAEETTSE